jgi:hypothetical protein
LLPTADQIELTLFGPGYGECAVVHLGNNRWVGNRLVPSPLLAGPTRVGIDAFPSLSKEGKKNRYLLLLAQVVERELNGYLRNSIAL